MRRNKKYQPEQVVHLLRQIEVAVANGKTTSLACRGEPGLWSRITSVGARSARSPPEGTRVRRFAAKEVLTAFSTQLIQSEVDADL